MEELVSCLFLGKRPATPADLSLTPSPDNIVLNLIVDGVLLKENLNKTGKDVNWLEAELQKQGILEMQDVFLATYDNQNNLSLYVKLQMENKHDFFE